MGDVGEDRPWMRVIPDYAPGWAGPLSRKLDGVFAEQAGMVDATDKPLPAVRVLLPGRAYDELERSVGGFRRGFGCTFAGARCCGGWMCWRRRWTARGRNSEGGLSRRRWGGVNSERGTRNSEVGVWDEDVSATDI